MENLPEQPEAPQGWELGPGLILPWAAARFSFSRSGGPGGQNVNKLATRAQLRVAVADLARLLTPAALERLKAIAGRRLVGDADLLLVCEDSRSQQMNKQTCLARLRALVAQALRPPTPRRPTRPTAGSRRRRLDTKRRQGQRKTSRQAPDDGD